MGMIRALGPIPFGAAVCMQSVHKIFPSRIGAMKWFRKREPIAVLDNITLGASSGEVVALMGPNGSGKSTLLKLIAATLLPDRGQVTVMGHDTVTRNLDVRRLVGLAVAQERSFYPRLTAEENLAFFASMEEVPRSRRQERIGCVLEQCGLGEIRNRLVHQLSSGMYQRLGIARALLKQPAVLLLDEPTRSADPETAVSIRSLIQTLAKGGTTVVLATHSFEEAAGLADSALLLKQGTVVTKLLRPDAGRLRSAYAKLVPRPSSTEEEAWEACL
jgi:ABC-2 type transport system ATP-binding protein